MQTRTLKVRTSTDAVVAKVTMGGKGPVGVLLAHGAGVGQDHSWMRTMRRLLAGGGYPVMTFDYAYMAQGRRAPDRLPRLLDVHEAALARFGDYARRIVLAGKSMGSRVGSHLVDERNAAPLGLIHYGYPLVPMGKKEPRDTEHLRRLDTPQLFFAGSRDKLSPPEVLAPIVAQLPDATLETVDDADHSFAVPKRSGRTTAEVLESIAATSVAWISRVAAAGSDPRRSGPG